MKRPLGIAIDFDCREVMSTKKLKTIAAGTRAQWRRWLAMHHDKEPGVWLVLDKVHTGRARLSYDDAVEEALCFGWIDSILKRIDEERYARKFTPRKAGSKWSSANRRRYSELRARGVLAAPGLRRAPTERSGDAPRPTLAPPRYIKAALKSDPVAWQNFEQLAPSYRRMYIGWIDSARKQETRAKRLREAIELLRDGRKLGLK